MVLSSAASDRIFKRNFKYIFAADADRLELCTSAWSTISRPNKDQIKTVAIAYENFLFTQSLARLPAQEAGEGRRARWSSTSSIRSGGQDFTSLLTKVKAANPDAFIVIDIMPSAVYMTRQMAEVGFRPKLYAVNIGPMLPQEFIGTLGKPQREHRRERLLASRAAVQGRQAVLRGLRRRSTSEPVDRRRLRRIIATRSCSRRSSRPARSTGSRSPQTLRGGKFDDHPRAVRIRRARREQAPAQLPGRRSRAASAPSSGRRRSPRRP